jgi:hypothetical protein
MAHHASCPLLSDYVCPCLPHSEAGGLPGLRIFGTAAATSAIAAQGTTDGTSRADVRQCIYNGEWSDSIVNGVLIVWTENSAHGMAIPLLPFTVVGHGLKHVQNTHS